LLRITQTLSVLNSPAFFYCEFVLFVDFVVPTAPYIGLGQVSLRQKS